MPVIPFEGHQPVLQKDIFIAPDAWVIGKVTIENKVSIYFNAVLRGDIQRIHVGSGTNIQEHVLVHTSHDLPDSIIGKNVTVGHHAIIHGCEVSDHCLIGMSAIILDGAKVGPFCIVGANSLITKNMQIPEGSLVMGTPAKVMRQLTTQERDSIIESAEHYQKLRPSYMNIFPTPAV